MNLFARIFSRGRIYTELNNSMREHLEEKVDELIQGGMSSEEATASARRAFGNTALLEQESREVWQWPHIESVFADIRVATRQLGRTPGFTSVALLIVALGIGATTAVFSIVNSVILQPYPFRDPSQLVVWRETVQEAGTRYPSVPDNYRHYLYLKSHSKTIANAAILQNASFAVAVGTGHPQIVKGLSVSPEFFSALGISPQLGRGFLPEEAQQGKDNSIVITWSAWQQFFNGDPSVVGRSLTVKGSPKTVVGVLPRAFEFPIVSEMPAGESPGEGAPYLIFQPFVPQEEERTADDSDFAFLVIARLKSGVSANQAGAELNGMLKAYGMSNHLSIHLGAIVKPLSQEITGNISKALWLLLTAVLGVLLIACVNLAGLQLARALARERDNAVRAALGAGRIRLFQASLMESIILSLLGGGAGVLLAFAGVRLFTAIAPSNLPRLHQIGISWPVLLFACITSMLTAVLSGTFPALRSLRSNPQRTLKSVSTRVVNADGAAFARKVLVSVEIAGTVMLLIVTSLTARSFSRVLNQHQAFNADQVTIAEVDLLGAAYDWHKDSSGAARAAFIDRVLARLRADPGVESVAITNEMPLTGDANVYSLYRPDHVLPDSEVPTANLRNVSPGYFTTMQTSLIAGETFGNNNIANPSDAIISQKAAQSAWPDDQPLGKKVKLNGRVYTVIGIAPDARIADLKEDIPVVYLPYWHDPPAVIFFLIRSSLASQALASSVRRQVWDIDPEAAIPVIKSLDTQMAESVSMDRLQAVVLSAFGISALVLAILGVYGVMAYSVSLRTPEFGVRIALGSNQAELLRLVLWDGAKPVLAGMVVGVVAAFGAAHAIRSLLYETSVADPESIASSIALLLLATLAAAFLPAYRAAKTDPMRVLRQE